MSRISVLNVFGRAIGAKINYLNKGRILLIIDYGRLFIFLLTNVFHRFYAMVNLILIRHGETNSNKTKTIMGHSNHSLNAVGTIQAKQCGAYIAKYYSNISAIYSSTLIRARETTDAISSQLQNDIEIEYLPELTERSFGDLEGQSADLVFSQLKNNDGLYDITCRPPKGESGIDFYTRVQAGIDRIIGFKDWTQNESILVLSHGGTIRHILGYLLFPKEKNYNNFPVEPYNCSITSVNVHNDSTTVNYINFYQYLNIEG